MNACFALAQLTALPLSPPELIEIAARTGYRYVGLRMTQVTPGGPHWPLFSDAALMRRTRAAMAATGIGVLDVELIRLTPDVDVAAFEPVMAAAAELKARHLLTQVADTDRARAIDAFGRTCDLAARYGLTADIEFPSWIEVGSLAAAAEVVRGASRANGGVLIDTLHLHRSGGTAAEIAALPPEWFRYVQFCDAPATIPTTLAGLLRTAREARDAPGEGELDLLAVLRALPPGLPLSLEVPNSAAVAAVGWEAHALHIRKAAGRLLAMF
jgi:sugar phosphate isomerase/epimerase